MWQYQKFLEFPINIKTPNPKLANFIISQYGGPYSICNNKKSNTEITVLLFTYSSFPPCFTS